MPERHRRRRSSSTSSSTSPASSSSVNDRRRSSGEGHGRAAATTASPPSTTQASPIVYATPYTSPTSHIPVVSDVYILQQPPQPSSLSPAGATSNNTSISTFSPHYARHHHLQPLNSSSSSGTIATSPSMSSYVTTITRRVNTTTSYDEEEGVGANLGGGGGCDEESGSNAFTTHHIVLAAPSPIVQAERVVVHITDVQPLSPLSPIYETTSISATRGSVARRHNNGAVPPLSPFSIDSSQEEGEREGQQVQGVDGGGGEGRGGRHHSRLRRFQRHCLRWIRTCLQSELCSTLILLFYCLGGIFYIGLFISSILALTDLSFSKQQELCPRSDSWMFVLMHVILAILSFLNHLTITEQNYREVVLYGTIWALIRVVWVFGFAIWGLYELWMIHCPKQLTRTLLYGVMAVHTFVDIILLCISFLVICVVMMAPPVANNNHQHHRNHLHIIP